MRDGFLLAGRYRRAAAAALAPLLVAASAQAQADNTAAAEALFEDGRTLYEAGKYAEGCPKLAESYRLDPATGTLLALALCREGEGKLATAWAKFRDAEGRAQQEGRDDRAQVASERAAALRPRLSTLTVHVPPQVAATPGFEIRVDGVVIGAGMFGVPVPVDGGEHRVEAAAPGKRAWQKVVAVKAESDAVRVMVEPLAEDAAAATPVAATPAATPPPQSQKPAQEPARKESSWSGMKTAALVTAGAGVVTLGVGSYLALDAKSDYEEADKLCPGGICPPGIWERTEDARSQGTIASVLFGVGAAAIGTGVVLWVLSPSGEGERDSVAGAPRVERLRIEPTGLRVEGTF